MLRTRFKRDYRKDVFMFKNEEIKVIIKDIIIYLLILL